MGNRKDTNFYVADFETAGNLEDGVRVWLWGLQNRSGSYYKYGRNLNEFMEECSKLLQKQNLVYLHNLRFDGSYILVWLMLNGYTYSDVIDDDMQFNSIITDTGLFYEVQFSNNGRVVKFNDSVKKIPLPVSAIPKAYGLDLEKLDMDYDAERLDTDELQENDLSYLKNDLSIPAQALDIQYNQGMVRMTASSDALADYKKRLGSNNFRKYFPELTEVIDSFCRESYKGGYTHAKKSIRGKRMGKGRVFDLHSAHPGQMKHKLLPYGQPIYFDGDIREDLLEQYPLYIIKVVVDFKVKKNYLPTIQIKNDIRFNGSEYIENSEGDVTITLTNIDYALMIEHYDIFHLEHVGAYYFQATRGLFDEYVDYWYAIKEDPNTPKGLVTIAKLYLNGLYGKFGTNPENIMKIPFLEDGVLKFKTEQKEDKKSVYVPMASFITAYSREQVIRGAQSIYPWFCYCDTDSIHFIDMPKDMDIRDYLDIHGSNIGTWGFESRFQSAVFYRSKMYKEMIGDNTIIKCAGLKSSILDDISFDEFELGVVFEHLKSRQVKGGVLLSLATYEVK